MTPATARSDFVAGAQTGLTLGSRTGRRKPAFLHGLLLAALLLTGCHILPAPQADPARFYQIGVKFTALPASNVSGTLKIGLRPVELPAYLQNRAMVVRNGTEIRYEDNHRWAEPLDEAIARIVRTRLFAAATVAAVQLAPFPIDEPRDFDVTVRVLTCEGARSADGKGTVQFTAIAEITRSDASHTVVWRKNILAPAAAWDGKDFSALAGLLDLAISTTGEDIAAALPAKK